MLDAVLEQEDYVSTLLEILAKGASRNQYSVFCVSTLLEILGLVYQVLVCF